LHRRRLLIAGVLFALFGAAPSAARSGGPAVPPGFVGMNLDDQTIASTSLNDELKLFPAVGVESVRYPIYWNAAQPYARPVDVPVPSRSRFVDIGGVPTDFAKSDRLVEASAQRGLRVMATVLAAPAWDSLHPERTFSPPTRPGPYADFLRTLIGRYGPHGSFWDAHRALPRLPIREWQVWNEESGAAFWADDEKALFPDQRHAWVHPYLALLRGAHKAIRRADPHARVVLGGLFGASWISMRQLYAADPHAGRYFDMAAVHPYTALLANVRYTLKLNRVAMAHGGDHIKPIVVTEFGWPSAAGRARPSLGFETNEAGQARLLTRGLTLLARERRRLRIHAVYWYTWAGTDTGTSVFSYAGVRHRGPDGRVVDKPALRGLRRTARTLEGCARAPRRTGCRLRP
jgi:hypothetical protein